jgi:hypothetical protein
MFTIKSKDVNGYSTKTHLAEIQWLASALSYDKDDGRFHTKINFIVTTIWVRDNGQAIATDGNRMHVLAYCSLDAGYYKVRKRTRWSITLEKVDIDDYGVCSFPDCDVVLAGQFQNGGTVEICGAEEDKADAEYANLIRKMERNSIRYPLFMDAINGMDAFNIKFDDSCTKAIYFTSDNRLAIVMPFRTE